MDLKRINACGISSSINRPVQRKKKVLVCQMQWTRWAINSPTNIPSGQEERRSNRNISDEFKRQYIRSHVVSHVSYNIPQYCAAWTLGEIPCGRANLLPSSPSLISLMRTKNKHMADRTATAREKTKATEKNGSVCSNVCVLAGRSMYPIFSYSSDSCRFNVLTETLSRRLLLSIRELHMKKNKWELFVTATKLIQVFSPIITQTMHIVCRFLLPFSPLNEV